MVRSADRPLFGETGPTNRVPSPIGVSDVQLVSTEDDWGRSVVGRREKDDDDFIVNRD